MTITVSPNDNDIETALRTFLLSALPQGAAAFGGLISGTTLTVTNKTSGSLLPGMTLNAPGLIPGTQVLAQLTGTLGGIGTYQVSVGQSISVENMNAFGVDVILGQINRVPQPAGPDFVVMWAMSRERLETNVDFYQDIPSAGNTTFTNKTRVNFQLDVHGPNSAAFAQIITTLFRDDYAIQNFQNSSNFPITPLYADDPRQLPFINAEDQYENRWVIDAAMQADQVVSGVITQFAAAAAMNLIINTSTIPP